MALLSIPNTLGAASIGYSVSCAVFGVMAVQLLIYFQRFPSDKLGYKLLIAALGIIELVDQIFVGHAIYYYTIIHYGAPLVLALEPITWTLILQLVLSSIVGTTVKVAFAIRVWRFSKKNMTITITIVSMILVQLGFAIAYCVRAFQLNKLIFAGQLRLVATVALCCGLATDFTIAAALCFFLRKMRTGFKKSDSLINTLSIYAINTGMLTGTISLLTVLLYNARPDTFFFMASYFSLGKLYVISFLCALNTRKVVRGRGTDREGGTSNASNTPNTYLMGTGNAGARRVPVNYPPGVGVSTTKSMEIGVHREISVIADLEEAAAEGEGGRDGTKKSRSKTRKHSAF